MKIVFFLFLFCHSVLFAGVLSYDTPKTIVADKVVIDMENETAKTEGKTSIFTETGQTMSLYNANVSKDLSVAGLNDAELYLSDSVRISAKKIEKQNQETDFYSVNYTACASKNNPSKICAWEIESGHLIHDIDEKEMYFHNNLFYVYSLPVLYIPWLAYPDPTVKRKTGFLFPVVSSSNRLGYEAEIPFYINFSDYHDLTLTPVFYSKENPMIQGEHRLNLNHSSFKTNASYIKERESEKRWHVFNSDLIELGSNARLVGEFNKTSDKTYLQEYSFYSHQPYLDSFLKLEGFSEQSYVVAEAHSFQNLRSESLTTNIVNADIVPKVHALVQTTPIFEESYFKFFGDVLTLDYRDNNTLNSRFIGEARYVFPTTLPFGQRLELSPAIRYDLYVLNHAQLIEQELDNDFTGTKNRFLPSGYLFWKWPFVKFSNGWYQTIEPKFRYFLVERNTSDNFINQDSIGTYLNDTNLFSDQRFSGYDIWDAGSYLDYGVSYSMFNSFNRGFDVFLGQAYDFYEPIDLDENSGYRKGFSDFVGRLNVYPMDMLNLAYRFRFSDDRLASKHHEVGFKFGKDVNFLDIGYIYNSKFDDALEEVNQSEIYTVIGFALTNTLNLYSSIRYNIEDDYLQNISYGLTYDNPCYNISLLYKDDRAVNGDFRGNKGFQLKFALKFTGNIDSNIH